MGHFGGRNRCTFESDSTENSRLIVFFDDVVLPRRSEVHDLLVTATDEIPPHHQLLTEGLSANEDKADWLIPSGDG